MINRTVLLLHRMGGRDSEEKICEGIVERWWEGSGRITSQTRPRVSIFSMQKRCRVGAWRVIRR